MIKLHHIIYVYWSMNEIMLGHLRDDYTLTLLLLNSAARWPNKVLRVFD